MDLGAFTSNDRGSVVKQREGYWAFHPARLPRELNLPGKTALLLDEATGAVHRLGGIGYLVPNPYLLIAPHLRLEAVLSSKIEGTQTDVAQLLRFEAGDTAGSGIASDAREVRNYVLAMEHGLDRVNEDFPISIRLFREVHEKLLTGVRGEHHLPGELRSSPVWIGGTNLNNAVFVPPPVDEMKTALSDLETFLHERTLPLLIQLGIAHYQFEAIHPFLDGNGRIGRLMIPLILVERGVLQHPLLYLSAFFERNREAYYEHLLTTSQTGDLIPWLEFFLTGVREQAVDAERRTLRIVELKNEISIGLLNDKQAPSVLRLADYLFYTPVFTAKMAAEVLGVSLPTANTAIGTLVARGELNELTGRSRGRLYEATRVFDAVYADLSP